MTQQSDPTTEQKPRPKALKVAAVCFSLVLLGGYVAYRSGATLMPSTKSGRVMPATDGAAPAAAPDERLIMPSSKSGPVTPPPPTTRAARRMMPGSKSAVLTEPVRDITSSSERPATQPATRPSSDARE